MRLVISCNRLDVCESSCEEDMRWVRALSRSTVLNRMTKNMRTLCNSDWDKKSVLLDWESDHSPYTRAQTDLNGLETQPRQSNLWAVNTSTFPQLLTPSIARPSRSRILLHDSACFQKFLLECHANVDRHGAWRCPPFSEHIPIVNRFIMCFSSLLAFVSPGTANPLDESMRTTTSKKLSCQNLQAWISRLNQWLLHLTKHSFSQLLSEMVDCGCAITRWDSVHLEATPLLVMLCVFDHTRPVVQLLQCMLFRRTTVQFVNVSSIQ